MKRPLILFSLFVILLSACGQTPPPAASTSSSSPFQASRTRTPTKTKRPTWTAFFASTRTPRRSPTPNDTEIAVHTSVQATWDAPGTLVAQYPTACKTRDYLVSPDEKWAALDCSIEKRFIVMARTGSEQWIINYEQIFGPPDEDNPFNYGGFHPIFWSPDSQFIYFEVFECCGGDGSNEYEFFGMPMIVAKPIYRLNTMNGDWTKVVPLQNYFSLSPTGRRLAFFNRSPGDMDTSFISIYTLDLRTGKITQKDLEQYPAAAHVVWAADGLKFVFTAIQREWDWPDFRVSLFLMDCESEELTLLHNFEASINIYSPISWTEENIITIQSEPFEKNLKISSLWFDLNTKQFISDPASP